jgi:hypothetical protein
VVVSDVRVFAQRQAFVTQYEEEGGGGGVSREDSFSSGTS